jgi:hypothetical protein
MGKHTVSLRIVRLSTQKAEIFGDTVPCSRREVVGVWVNIQMSHMVSVVSAAAVVPFVHITRPTEEGKETVLSVTLKDGSNVK